MSPVVSWRCLGGPLKNSRCHACLPPHGLWPDTYPTASAHPVPCRECTSSCTAPACKQNRRISERGIEAPLEVFRTPGKGWGVRCASDLQGGDVICSYEGHIITHHEAVRGKLGRGVLAGRNWFAALAAPAVLCEHVALRGCRTSCATQAAGPTLTSLTSTTVRGTAVCRSQQAPCQCAPRQSVMAHLLPPPALQSCSCTKTVPAPPRN